MIDLMMIAVFSVYAVCFGLSACRAAAAGVKEKSFERRDARSRRAGNLLLYIVTTVVLLAVMTTSAPADDSPPVFAEPLHAHFRGCASAGWCAFSIEALDPLATSIYRVYPDGIRQTPDDAARSVAVRDRLNALLANMVHQHKRIVLYDLRAVGGRTYSATVEVNGENIASDPILLELQEGTFAGTSQLP